MVKTLIPFDLAVDSNRDGVIKFAGNFNDEATLGKPQDTTSEAKPFRFWLNDDEDDNANTTAEKDAEKVTPTTPDHSDGLIKTKRDLEDFTRLNIYLGGLQDAILQGTIKVGLKWKNTTGNPAVKVWQNLSPNGGNEYLTDDGVAGQHLQLNTPGNVQGTLPYIIPTIFWQQQGFSATQPNGYMLIEGSGEGKGQLVISLHKSDGTEMGEGPGVWFHLVNVRKMYERAKATGIADNFEEPSQTSSGNPPEPSMGFVPDPNGQQFDNSAASWQETKKYIVFVHGWNMSYEASQKFAETMFKRLWQCGYKGRFASMRWPTLDDSFVGIPYTYNASEYRAWKCGESLKQFLASLPAGYTKNLVSHSMGGIVAGSGLNKGMTVENYVLLNAAVPAICYDDRTVSNGRSVLDENWGYTTPVYDPDAGTRNLSYRYKLNSVSGNLINFYLPLDGALQSWELNNYTSGAFSLGAKPQRYNGSSTGYYYDPAAPAGQRLGIKYLSVEGRFVTTSHEGMAYIAQSPTKTVGANGQTVGSIGSSVNMTDYGFSKVHSAEFTFSIQKVQECYYDIIKKLGIRPNYLNEQRP